jgi:hypothetical protein
MLFTDRSSRKERARRDVQSDLIEMVLGVDEVGRKRLLLLALQTGELRRSEAADFLRLVDRLESAGRPIRASELASAGI